MDPDLIGLWFCYKRRRKIFLSREGRERRQLSASQKEHGSEYTNAGTWTVLPASKTVRKPFLKIKPPNLWNSVIATQADLNTHTHTLRESLDDTSFQYLLALKL